MEAWERASAGKSEVLAGCRHGMWEEMNSGKIGEVQGKGWSPALQADLLPSEPLGKLKVLSFWSIFPKNLAFDFVNLYNFCFPFYSFLLFNFFYFFGIQFALVLLSY